MKQNLFLLCPEHCITFLILLSLLTYWMVCDIWCIWRQCQSGCIFHQPEIIRHPFFAERSGFGFLGGENAWEHDTNDPVPKIHFLINSFNKYILEDSLFCVLLISRISSVQFISFTQSCLTICDPVEYSTPGFPVHHQLPELAQTHVHRVGDTIQPSHPLLSPSPPAFSLSQHQGLFQWISSSHQVAKVLEFQLQHQSFQWIFRTNLL